MSAVTSERPRYKRSFKNYLIDSRFQLKYTSYILLVTVVLSVVLGGFLWRESQHVVAQGEKVAAESKKVSDMMKINDPVYALDPDLAKSVSAASADANSDVEKQRQELVAQQNRMLISLVAGLSLFVVFIGLLGIFITHKVAGPIYKMKMLLRQVGSGKLNFHGKLRKGDELQEFFEAFATMAEQLKARQADEVQRLSDALAIAETGNMTEDGLAKIRGVRDEMRASLEL
jgi:methyl-accepting chemotaxis protein